MFPVIRGLRNKRTCNKLRGRASQIEIEVKLHSQGIGHRLRRVKTVHSVILNAQKGILVLVCAIVTVVIFLEVILRYAVKYPLIGLELIASDCAFWMYFIGASVATYEGSHIKAELINVVLRSPRVVALSRVVVSVIALGICCYVTIWAYDYFIWGIVKHELMPYFYLPMVLFQSSIFFGHILMCFYFLIGIVNSINHISGSLSRKAT